MIQNLNKTLQGINYYAYFCKTCGVLLAERSSFNKLKMREMPTSIVSQTEGLCGRCELKEKFERIYKDWIIQQPKYF